MTALLVAFLAAASPSALPVRAVTIDGQTIEGQWAGPGNEGEIRIEAGGAAARVLSLDELLSLKWPAATTIPASEPLPLLIHLKDGSRTPARILSGGQRQIAIETRWSKSLTVPLSLLRAIRFVERQNPAAQEAFEQALADPKATEDRLIVVKNERPTTLKGLMESLSPDGGSFRWRERSIPVKAPEVYGVVLAAETSEVASAPAACTMRDGSIWAGRITGVSTESIRLQPASEGMFDLPIDQIGEIRFRSERVRFLDELTPAKYEFEPFGATRWPYRVNRSAANRPMRIGGQSFDRGIGVHSRSVLTYDVPQGFRRLAATIGIDEAVGDQGNVIFRVLADGREVFNSSPVTGRDAPRPLLATIEGARRIQLVVEYGEDLDIGDQADWAEARLIK